MKKQLPFYGVTGRVGLRPHEGITPLKIVGIHAFSLANNHCLDFEYEGIFEMLKILEDAGISHTGAEANFEEG